MKKIYLYTLIISMSLYSCQGLVSDINEDPNGITIEDIDAELFVTGTQLANVLVQCGHLNRISGLYSGQLIGFSSLYSNIYGYDLSAAESNSTWSHIYVGIIPNVRYIRTVVPDDKLLVGMSKVIEANAIGTGAAIFGDIPYFEINNLDIDSGFDSQVAILTAMTGLLDDAISDLSGANSRNLPVDIYFGGDADKWKAAAYTLKARYYLLMKDYANAYTAAQNGISSAADNLMFRPQGDPSVISGDKNLFWEILEGSRSGDIGNSGSYMMDLIDPSNGASRNNAKTDETARFGYLFVNASSGSDNDGIIEQYEPMAMITYRENQLILAESAARTVDFATSLGHLNDLRAYLDGGGYLNANYSGDPFQYDAYDAADFDNGGIENADNIDPTRALLREIIEERYVSGFLTYMPFNDARRLRKSDSDIAVAIPFNVASATQHPERLPYSDDEINSNSNISADPGLYVVTEVNQ